MQAQRAAKRGGVGTIPRRGGRWLGALLTVAAILVIVALMALITRGMVAPADTGGVGPRDAKAGVASSAVVHDDTGIMHASMVKDMRQGAVKNTGIMISEQIARGRIALRDDTRALTSLLLLGLTRGCRVR